MDDEVAYERDAITTIGGDARTTIVGDQTTLVGGASTIEASEVIIRAGTRLVFEVGRHRLILDEFGLAVELEGSPPLQFSSTGTAIRCDVAGGLELKADNLALAGTTTVAVTAGGAVTVTGAPIRLN